MGPLPECAIKRRWLTFPLGFGSRRHRPEGKQDLSAKPRPDALARRLKLGIGAIALATPSRAFGRATLHAKHAAGGANVHHGVNLAQVMRFSAA